MKAIAQNFENSRRFAKTQLTGDESRMHWSFEALFRKNDFSLPRHAGCATMRRKSPSRPRKLPKPVALKCFNAVRSRPPISIRDRRAALRFVRLGPLPIRAVSASRLEPFPTLLRGRRVRSNSIKGRGFFQATRAVPPDQVMSTTDNGTVRANTRP